MLTPVQTLVATAIFAASENANESPAGHQNIDKNTLNAQTVLGVIFMSKKKEIGPSDVLDMRVDPEKQLCPKFDSTSIALFPVADSEEMGVRVLDDCAEEHIM